MKNLLSILIYLIMINSLWAVNHYSGGDILYVIDDKVSLRSEPDINSKSLVDLRKGNVVRALETKLDKSGDFSLVDDDTNWQSVLTGKWIKVKFGNIDGYIFDAYLSHYNFKELINPQHCITFDTLSVQDFEMYTRTMFQNGVIYENGLGMEWGREIFMIPDFTFEEAILFIKPTMFLYSGEDPKWLISNNQIKLDDSNSISSGGLQIIKFGEYIIIEITDGD